MQIRIRKSAGWNTFRVEYRHWYWPFWRLHESHGILSRAQDIARELRNPVTIETDP